MIKKNKKAVSEVLGYILLISFTVFMSFIVYQGLKTYVPEKAVECPDGVSVFVQNVACTINSNGSGYNLSLSVKNNGRYNVAGYFIHASYNPNQTVATADLIDYLDSNTGYKLNNAVVFDTSTSGNLLNMSEIVFARFNNIPSKVYSIDLIPIRFQKQENRLRTVSCGKAIVREKIICS